MIAYFDDTLGSPPARPILPVDTHAVAGALELCIAARDCLILASKTVAQLSRSAAEIGELKCVEELRRLRTELWESRAVVEARIIALRRVQGAHLTPHG
jgi:hypothetical protein